MQRGICYLGLSVGGFAEHSDAVKPSDGGHCCRRAWAVFTEKLMTTEVYLNTASEVSPGALLLFGGELKRHRDTLTVVDGFINFETDRRCADLITEMRHALDQVLQSKLEMPHTDVSHFSRPLIQASIELLRYH